MSAAERDPDSPTNLPSCSLGQTSWPVRWTTREVPYMVNRLGHDSILPSVDGEIHPDVLLAVRSSMRQWSDQGCSDFEFKYAGLTDVNAHSPEDGVNVITWVGDRWAETTATIALTSTTMTRQGVVVDADMEFNVRAHRFSISTPVASGAMDLANTTTHEAGHMLGLDEAPSKDATMYYSAPTEELKKRDLHPDDIAGICTIYPKDVPTAVYGEQYTPGGGDCAPGEEGCGDDDGGCCSTVRAPTHPGRLWVVFAMILGLMGWRRRRTGVR